MGLDGRIDGTNDRGRMPLSAKRKNWESRERNASEVVMLDGLAITET